MWSLLKIKLIKQVRWYGLDSRCHRNYFNFIKFMKVRFITVDVVDKNYFNLASWIARDKHDQVNWRRICNGWDAQKQHCIYLCFRGLAKWFSRS